MSAYEQELIAAGIDHEQAARDAWADTLQFWRNREHASYGRYDPNPPSAEDVCAAYEFKMGDIA